MEHNYVIGIVWFMDGLSSSHNGVAIAKVINNEMRGGNQI